MLLPRPHGLDSLDEIGDDNITFETDYPHTGLDLARHPGGGRADGPRALRRDVYRIMRGNAIRMLGLDIT